MPMHLVELEEIKMMESSDEALEISSAEHRGVFFSNTCPVQGVDGEYTPCTGI